MAAGWSQLNATDQCCRLVRPHGRVGSWLVQRCVAEPTADGLVLVGVHMAVVAASVRTASVEGNTEVTE